MQAAGTPGQGDHGGHGGEFVPDDDRIGGLQREIRTGLPMAMPVCAAASAGAALTPSPSTRTLRPFPDGGDLALWQQTLVDLGEASLGGLFPARACGYRRRRPDGGHLAGPGHPVPRILILARLREGPCPVTKLAQAVGMQPSACSHQLRLLRNPGLVTGQRHVLA